MGADGKRLAGSDFDRRKLISLPYVQQEQNYTPQTNGIKTTGSEALAGLQQDPTDEAAALTKVYDVDAIKAAALATPAVKLIGKIQLGNRLPDVLTAVSVSFIKSLGVGASNYPTANQAFYIENQGSGGFSPKASAQASASIVPNLFKTIVSHGEKVVNSSVVSYYATSPIVIADVLTRLTIELGATVTDLPVFKPEEVELALSGGQVSVLSRANTTTRVAWAADDLGDVVSKTTAFEWGNEYSGETGLTSRVETIRPTLHAAITIASNTDSQAVSVTVSANTIVQTDPDGDAVPAITNAPGAVSATASASVKTSAGTAVISATTQTDIPKTGLYLVDLQCSQDDFGVIQVTGIVVNMLQYV